MVIKIESEIMRRWICRTPPIVSIVCITYNQAKYIADAIDGFLKQETCFPFEIIIQDDASTDQTREIIAGYALKFPNLIKPILHAENQFSQYRKNVFLNAITHAKGKYIALCEGDDFWIDPQKLQIQISEMQQNPSCNFSFHPILTKYTNKRKKERIHAYHCIYRRIFKTNTLILRSAAFCPTASLIFRREVFQFIPDWFLDAPIEDYFLQILASLNGNALYINRVMAAYRMSSDGSWTEKMSTDRDFVYDYFVRMLKSLNDLDEYTGNIYNDEINFIRKKLCFYMCVNPVLSLKTRKEIFKTHESKFGIFRKITWNLVYKNIKLLQLALRVKNYFSK